MFNRPVVLVGNGIRPFWPRWKEYLEALGAPILLTWRAMDLLPENHPLFFGRPGIVAQRNANIALTACDFLLCLGARLDPGITAYDLPGMAPEAIKVCVDVDQDELDKLPPSFRRIHQSLAECPPLKPQRMRCSNWIGFLTELKKNYGPDFKEGAYGVIADLNERCNYDVIVPASSGAASELFCQTWRTRENQRIINSPALGSMGFGVPAAIGASLATGKRVLCIEGDGGFCMNLQELEVVRRLWLPITFAVLNNNGYGSIRDMQKRHFGHLVGSSESMPNISALVLAYGIPVEVNPTVSRVDLGPRVEIHDAETTIWDKVISVPRKPVDFANPFPHMSQREMDLIMKEARNCLG